MDNMLPGNSFPQICVVSVNKHVDIAHVTHEHGGSMSKSNQESLLIC